MAFFWRLLAASWRSHPLLSVPHRRDRRRARRAEGGEHAAEDAHGAAAEDGHQHDRGRHGRLPCHPGRPAGRGTARHLTARQNRRFVSGGWSEESYDGGHRRGQFSPELSRVESGCSLQLTSLEGRTPTRLARFRVYGHYAPIPRTDNNMLWVVGSW